MKSLSLIVMSLCVASPITGWAVTCVPYSNITYAIQAGSASGTLVKSQTCPENASSGSYSITSQINVSKGIFSRQINQTANGTYTSPNTINAQGFTSSNNSAAFPAHDVDPMSLVLYLSSSLMANITTFSPQPLFDNGDTITVKCTVSNPNASVPPVTGNPVAATQVTCITADKTKEFDYFFSQDGAAMMLKAISIENGTQTLSSLINSYTLT